MSSRGTPALTKGVNQTASTAVKRLSLFGLKEFLQAVLRRLRGLGRTGVIGIPYLWLLAFFLIPFVIVLKISLAETEIAQPPYTSLWYWVEQKYLNIRLNLGNYQYLIQDSLYWNAYLNSVKIAAVSTFVCLLIGYPMAYGIARARPDRRVLLLMLVILPLYANLEKLDGT
ncbi:MAG: hypothetical protein WBN78_09835, partial [Gammaproteobacteria bacterium]